MARTGFLYFGVEMPVEAKGAPRSAAPDSDGKALLTQNLRACWRTPRDTLITGDLPLLLTRLSRLPAVPGEER